MYPIVQQSSIHVDVFVLAGCRRSIIFVLIQVIHFMFIARNIMLMMMMMI